MQDKQTPYAEILAAQIAQELRELQRKSSDLLLSGLSAGLDIGYSLLMMAVMLDLAVTHQVACDGSTGSDVSVSGYGWPMEELGASAGSRLVLVGFR